MTTTIFTEMSFFCHQIGVKSVETAGIIIEYNPMHSGHQYLLERTRTLLGPETAVIGVMSGDFVQRGDFALVRRQARARAAVESGVDLVLELPLPWAAAPAERFAAGGVEVLAATGLVVLFYRRGIMGTREYSLDALVSWGRHMWMRLRRKANEKKEVQR